MGKKGGSSWLTAVKRAFRSPTKDTPNRSCRRRVDEEEEEKKKEKKRWLFRKASNSGEHNEGKLATSNDVSVDTSNLPREQRNAIAVAAATAAAAEAAAQAAVEILRLTRPSNPNSVRQHHAAILIQTAFRGFLARRALIALRGFVKLQALIRGQNVRKQAKMTLKCMQALLRVQARLRDQRSRLSHDGGRRSMFAETTNLWESRYLQDIRDRKSMCRDGDSFADDWSECPRTLEELEAILEARKEASFRRERSLAHAFSHQIWDDNEQEERPNLLEKGTPTKQWDTISRGSTDKRESVKTVEIDTLKPYSHGRKSQYYCSPHHKQASQQHIAASPRHRTTTHNSNYCMVQPPVTPSPSKTRPLQQTRPASPRCLEKSYSTANTPSLRSAHRYSSSTSRYGNEGAENFSFQIKSRREKEIGGERMCHEGTSNATVPNYMAATESAKAKSRSQSAPRSRPATPERDRGGGLARKRLSYPVQETYCGTPGFGYNSNFGGFNLRSPSFKSVQAGYVGMEQQSNLSYYTDSIGGELSPCSTTDLRRWLR